MHFNYRGQPPFLRRVALARHRRARAARPPTSIRGAIIEERYRAYDDAFGDLPHTVCYAVKANSYLGVAAAAGRAGAGFDIVSGGELYRVLQAGGDPAKVVFSGVGKTAEEVEYALAAASTASTARSEPELALIDAWRARRGVRAGFAIRVNPDVDASTHPYISTGLRAAQVRHRHLRGRRTSTVAPARSTRLLARRRELPHRLADARPRADSRGDREVLELVDRLRAAGPPIRHHRSRRRTGCPTSRRGPGAADRRLHPDGSRDLVARRGLHVMVEPGRSIVGEAGVLLARVLYRKRNGEKEFVVVDAAMNDLIRPALYQAHHEIIPLFRERPCAGDGRRGRPGLRDPATSLPADRDMADVLPGDFVAVCTAGAYGFVQSSNYNSRPRAPEVLVEGSTWRVVRKRESYEDLVRGE